MVTWEWLTRRQRRGGSPSVQPANGYRASAFDHAILILARYQRGEGIKAIAKSLKVEARAVAVLLNEGGVSTAARRTHNNPRTQSYLRSSHNYHQKRKFDFGYMFGKKIQARMGLACEGSSVSAGGAFRFVGCTADALRAHLAKQFTKGMSWENYGAWHIDHIVPCAVFDLTDETQIRTCFNWQNLRPLWARDNIRKGAKITAGQLPLAI